MKKQDATILLKELILQKEIECSVERVLMKEQFKVTIESLKPINLIKNTLASPNLQNNALDAVIGMASGYIAKKIVVRSSHNPLLKLAGSLLQIGVTGLVTKNPEIIKLIGGTILKKLFSKKEPVTEKI